MAVCCLVLVISRQCCECVESQPLISWKFSVIHSFLCFLSPFFFASLFHINLQYYFIIKFLRSERAKNTLYFFQAQFTHTVLCKEFSTLLKVHVSLKFQCPQVTCVVICQENPFIQLSPSLRLYCTKSTFFETAKTFSQRILLKMHGCLAEMLNLPLFATSLLSQIPCNKNMHHKHSEKTFFIIKICSIRYNKSLKELTNQTN